MVVLSGDCAVLAMSKSKKLARLDGQENSVVILFVVVCKAQLLLGAFQQKNILKLKPREIPENRISRTIDSKCFLQIALQKKIFSDLAASYRFRPWLNFTNGNF